MLWDFRCSSRPVPHGLASLSARHASGGPVHNHSAPRSPRVVHHPMAAGKAHLRGEGRWFNARLTC